jgi:hypothetical protein
VDKSSVIRGVLRAAEQAMYEAVYRTRLPGGGGGGVPAGGGPGRRPPPPPPHNKRTFEKPWNLNLDPITIREGVEIARDLRTMLAGMLGYRVKESPGQLPRPGDRL